MAGCSVTALAAQQRCQERQENEVIAIAGRPALELRKTRSAVSTWVSRRARVSPHIVRHGRGPSTQAGTGTR